MAVTKPCASHLTWSSQDGCALAAVEVVEAVTATVASVEAELFKSDSDPLFGHEAFGLANSVLAKVEDARG